MIGISMRRMVRASLAGLAVFGALVWPSARPLQAQATRADSAQAVFRRAQRLVNDGQGIEGRALVDSMLNAAEPRSPEEAEALFWRATLAESWEGAQRDYLRIMLEHDRSSRAGDAMLRLAQGEAARGDRDAAVRYLERLASEAPESDARAEGALWHGRLLIERGDLNGGCGVLRNGRAIVRAGQVELENQYDYLMRACPDPAAVAEPAAPAPVATTLRAPARDSAPAPRAAPPVAAPAPSAAPPPTTRSGPPMWSVQVAAVSTSAEATAMVQRLRDRGYDARIDGTAAPFRVRFGRFPTRAAATAALEGYKAKEKAAAFLVEVPRG